VPKSKIPKLTLRSNQSASPTKPKPKEQVEKRPKKLLSPDAREQLYNEGSVGPITQVQVSTERIANLNGILLDLDPGLLKQGPLIPNLPADPDQFLKQCVQQWLERHPVLEALELRMSGTGLHGILWLEPAVEFADDAERDRWCATVQIVQATLPTDPNAPGITATTRAIGSTNTKNDKVVRLLKKGDPVCPSDVIELQEQMCAAPFKTLFSILTGTDRMSPCPFCGKDETSLAALDYVGKCYGCGTVTFERLCSELFLSGKSKKE
jgi:hypothetical protein